jgi:hypothetical protein
LSLELLGCQLSNTYEELLKIFASYAFSVKVTNVGTETFKGVFKLEITTLCEYPKTRTVHFQGQYWDIPPGGENFGGTDLVLESSPNSNKDDERYFPGKFISVKLVVIAPFDDPNP